MRTNIIIRYTGLALVLISVMMGASAAVAMFNGFDDSTMPLVVSTLLTFIVGAYPLIFVRTEPNISPNEGVAIVVMSWIACCIFGMIPYICYGDEFTIINAFFESTSGFTTTGASILNNIESLPKGLLFWRVSTSWIGALGIVSFFSLLIPRSMDTRSVLSSAELSELTRAQSSKRGKSFVFTILCVYCTLTVACAISLRLAGMGWFDAVTNAMSTCSTCGFCVRNASIASYGNLAVELIILGFMTTCGISFMLLASLVTGGMSEHRKMSTTTAAFLAFIAAGTVVVSLNLHFSSGIPIAEALRLAAFQVSSISTTTGFATTDTSCWPALSIIILLAGSIVCGCSGSTSGGIKMDRIVLLFKYIRNGVRRGATPNRILNASLDGHWISDHDAGEAMKFVLVYVSLIAAGAIINILFGLDIQTGVTASIACIGNVGPGFGEVGSMGNYAELPGVLKFTNALLMIAGRLEIFPILSFIGIYSANRRIAGIHRSGGRFAGDSLSLGLNLRK